MAASQGTSEHGGRVLLGLNVTQWVLKALLAQYKHLEQEIITLKSMAQDDCYYTMLVEGIGLTNWGCNRECSL